MLLTACETSLPPFHSHGPPYSKKLTQYYESAKIQTQKGTHENKGKRYTPGQEEVTDNDHQQGQTLKQTSMAPEIPDRTVNCL